MHPKLCNLKCFFKSRITCHITQSIITFRIAQSIMYYILSKYILDCTIGHAIPNLKMYFGLCNLECIIFFKSTFQIVQFEMLDIRKINLLNCFFINIWIILICIVMARTRDSAS